MTGAESPEWAVRLMKVELEFREAFGERRSFGRFCSEEAEDPEIRLIVKSKW